MDTRAEEGMTSNTNVSNAVAMSVRYSAMVMIRGA
ncbi:MAG: hypothetical protein BWY93_01820 [Euryarchaeota archaeon ADurb.BinA087]|nr:MAG: hypothetical protein BWY93_01820 [Euryarchaeota archaeon ADurb.BinA087]